MSVSVSPKRKELKKELLNLYQNKENYNIVSLYRQLLTFNDKLKLYLPPETYTNYTSELYNMIDIYLYDENINDNGNHRDNAYEEISKSINNIYIIITEM